MFVQPTFDAITYDAMMLRLSLATHRTTYLAPARPSLLAPTLLALLLLPRRQSSTLPSRPRRAPSALPAATCRFVAAAASSRSASRAAASRAAAEAWPPAVRLLCATRFCLADSAAACSRALSDGSRPPGGSAPRCGRSSI